MTSPMRSKGELKTDSFSDKQETHEEWTKTMRPQTADSRRTCPSVTLHTR